MPIAIESEHVELAKSVRSLLEKVAPAEVLHAALETPVQNPPVYWRGAAEQVFISPSRWTARAPACLNWRS